MTSPPAKFFTKITGWINTHCTILPFNIIVHKELVCPQNVISSVSLLVNACFKLSCILLTHQAGFNKALDYQYY